MDEVFIARQPIFARDLSVFGYELLFREAGASEEAQFINGDQATSQVILNAFTVVGLDQLVGRRRAFINLTREFLVGAIKLPFPAERVVLELLEDLPAERALLDAVQQFRDQGYMVSLDDYTGGTSQQPFLSQVDIVKVDVAQLDVLRLRSLVESLKRYGVELLAQKVETQEMFELCRDAGFDYFQGFFLSRPRTIRGSSIPTNRLPTLNLMAKLYQPEVDLRDLEQIISSDVSLSYKLLRYMNSAFFPIQRRIDSIHQAVVYLGVRELQSWASLLAMASVTDKPSELMTTLMVRARMCQKLAERLGYASGNTYFTVGLFSGLDALMDAQLEEVLMALPLSDEVIAALLRHEGRPGRVLECVLHYELGDWDWIESAGYNPAVVIQSYLDSIDWAREIAARW
ncbi:EAL and modified HD-GYP domain-containing signal transduction protein [Natronocella acetinitrilica]|uniref:EAL and modified HD-GYP domain-containing signal transduction protein n=1 Tax=Natronocella acetinitrilica TaxID=414046 RepID=A0AAE3G0B8_9GAMM|nr:HDOD domain-containing protein [Natronocella acetinitrilica]MCP1673156.1 EAL and modified HD-GYP domain-containing signal transduction protein [Natronocella acetinitrilica]